MLMGVALCFHSLLEGAAMGAQVRSRLVLVVVAVVGVGGARGGGGHTEFCAAESC